MFCNFTGAEEERLNILAAVSIFNKKRKEGEKEFAFYALELVLFLPLLVLFSFFLLMYHTFQAGPALVQNPSQSMKLIQVFP